MENNRTILAIALIILVWSGYSLLFPPKPAVSPQIADVQQMNISSAVPQKAQIVATEVVENLNEVVIPQTEKLVKVESNLYIYELSTNGARLEKAILKKYKEENKKDASPVNIVNAENSNFATFKTSGSEGFSLSGEMFYALQNERTEYLIKDNDTQTITFIGKTETGFEIQKSFTFYADSYQVDINVKLINRSPQTKTGTFDLSLINKWDDSLKGDSYNFVGPTTLVGDEIIEDDPEDLQTASKTYTGDFVWSGFQTKYFATIVSPQSNSTKKLNVERGDGYVETRFTTASMSINPSESVNFEFVSYLGPKDYDILKKVGNRFDEAIDLGFFSMIAHPLMVALKFFHGYLGNWGFAIILLTVSIKAIFWPLTQKSYSSMKSMQKLQPKMAKLREKYASDKQRLNTEMMALYKENRVNPFGGCLPIVIQIPVFFALYQVLLHSIELRHAPFMFWLTDLSAKDPYYVTPLIMGVTMFLQQKMSPTTMDPTQARLMMMMPVVFTFLFLNFPSGLVIYWLVNNILTIAQQYMINRKPA